MKQREDAEDPYKAKSLLTAASATGMDEAVVEHTESHSHRLSERGIKINGWSQDTVQGDSKKPGSVEEANVALEWQDLLIMQCMMIKQCMIK